MSLAIAELDKAKRAKNGDSEADTSGPESESEISELPVELPPATHSATEEYRQLYQSLLLLTLAFSIAAFVCVWIAYSLGIALNYALGALTGIVYFRMLAKSVGKIGRGKSSSGGSRLAIFVGVMVVSTQWQQLSVLPVFLGFLTYKAALIAFVVWTAVMPPAELDQSVELSQSAEHTSS